MPDEVIAEISKNSLERLRLMLRVYRSREFIDLRQWYLDDAGEVRPTKRGVTIPLDCWDEFAQAVAKMTTRLDVRDGVSRSKPRHPRAQRSTKEMES